ncbi:hypothetical protein J2S74_004787 [Evansella vedderi]|uniref:Uncharacterized protein n=1 Tax=Evansella vedderi TaxID=38282 RepID=A0ABU0A1G5_9BACI|nr:hypothetical protein [Evansella vedderi]MDQ0257329.1 hypothetical protein [Evansella vedderi]
MPYESYINLTDKFIDSLREYIKKRQIPLEEVVEVFAGNGKLGLQLGLKKNNNISDLLLFTTDDFADEVNSNWERNPQGVVKESAYETIMRFYNSGQKISMLIIGAPPPANSYYCPSYKTIKALYDRFDAEILYIGEMNSPVFASPKFFRHLKAVPKNIEKSFKSLVESNYDNRNGYFSSDLFYENVDVRPHLLKFVPCSSENCDCSK